MSFNSHKKHTLEGFNFIKSKFPNISLNAFSFIKGQRSVRSYHTQGLAMDINTDKKTSKAILQFLKKDGHVTKFAEIGTLPLFTGLHLAYKPFNMNTRYFTEGLRDAKGKQMVYPCASIDELIGKIK